MSARIAFTYTWSDGLTSGNAATVVIDVYNNTPYAYDASFSVLHDRELTGSVYGYDPDGDAITAQLVSGPTNGTLTLNPDGTFTYTPEHALCLARIASPTPGRMV
jgi:sugar lactone lactonase YvrE